MSPNEPRADEAPRADGQLPRPTDRRRTARRFALAATIVCAVILLYPVIASPITGDDRHWYLWTAARTDGSFVELVRWWWERIPARLDFGRVNVVTEFERRLAGLAIMKAAVATSAPIAFYQGLMKLALFGGGILSILAFVRSLRWRTSAGTLIAVSRNTLVLVGLAVTLLAAAGAQAQNQGRNGWTAYPINTYSAVIVIFGSVALVLWLTRLVSDRSRTMAVVAAGALALLAVLTNFRYELEFPVIPIAAVALLIVPVTDRTRRAAGRRAKLVTGSAYIGTFFLTFIVTRSYLGNVCADRECYEGVQAELGTAVVRTATYNFLSAIPGAASGALHSNLNRVGWADRYPVPVQWWSILLGLIVIGILLTCWFVMNPNRQQTLPVADDQSTHKRAEAQLLMVGAGLSLLVALGTSAVMGISSQSHDLITKPGIPYRNIVVTWVALATCVVLVLAALNLVWPRRRAFVAWTSIALVAGIGVTVTLPGDLMALRAHRVSHAVTDAINWEVVQGDTTPAGESRRCALLDQLEDEPETLTQRVLPKYAETAFQRIHDQPFCSERSSMQARG
jgi:hypothetical protein